MLTDLGLTPKVTVPDFIIGDYNSYGGLAIIPTSQYLTLTNLLDQTAGLDDQANSGLLLSPSDRVPLSTYFANAMPSRIRPAGQVVTCMLWAFFLV